MDRSCGLLLPPTRRIPAFPAAFATRDFIPTIDACGYAVTACVYERQRVVSRGRLDLDQEMAGPQLLFTREAVRLSRNPHGIIFIAEQNIAPTAACQTALLVDRGRPLAVPLARSVMHRTAIAIGIARVFAK
ncbi:MAG: hypothetical protein WCF84_06655 [Anaerolineae bacterium]